MSLSDRDFEAEIPVGALWALSGALLYALYLVLLRRRVDNEDKLNIPMFFGKSQEYVVTAYSHCTGTGPGQVQGTGPGAMGTAMLYRNVHTGPRQGKGPRSIVSYCACQVPCTCPGPVPVQCE